MPGRNQLHMLNESIRHLQLFLDDVRDVDSGVGMEADITDLVPDILDNLKTLRRSRFEHLVDWYAVAGGTK